MQRQSDVHTIIAHLVEAWHARTEAPENQPEALKEAQDWLQAHNSSHDPRTLAQDTLASLDTLLRALQGGMAMDALLDAREALAKYINREPGREDRLSVRLAPSGGVSLIHGGRHLTINDDELDMVREAINTRKREVRKHQRRQHKEQS